MRIETGTIGALPPEWPEHGELDGRSVRLDRVEVDVDPFERANVIVTLPGGRTLRPWRGIGVRVYDDDGRLLGGS